MAINIKSIIADTVLNLCQEKSLNKVTIADIQEASGVSRQTFYNHFKDKFDLIQYIYETRIISQWMYPSDKAMDYYEATLSCLRNDVTYHVFMAQACRMSGANCLIDHMYAYSRQFDREWYQFLYGPTPMPPELVFASDYHSAAKMQMRLQWILNGVAVPPEELLKTFLRLRLFSLSTLLLAGSPDQDPYRIAAGKDVTLQSLLGAGQE